MRVIKIMGGLGNQMFQYAYGRNLELKGEKVIFDVSFFYGNKSVVDINRNFKLDKFNLMTKADFSKKQHPFLDCLVKIKRKFGFFIDIDYPSEKYLKGNEQVIRKEFTLKKSLSQESLNILKNIKENNAVSIHIRRGDYVSNNRANKHHGLCGLDYYFSAIKYIQNKIQNPKFFVFSDDPNWVKDNFKNIEYLLVSDYGLDDIEELILMGHCNHHIIANSSFSWWGAWLSENKDKIVVSPKVWLKANPQISDKIIPSNWVKI